MILLLFNEMKLLAFVGDFFTPMLSFLLFFYSHSTILCFSFLLHCSAFLSNSPQPLYPVPSALLSFYLCAVLILS
ncbi:expressed protein [Phakopsora pachyrhizi]|uniref:Expressed protein n=1 Tax=Phakopsora pachyrhizi TaxID=170000 RepID=A0AAV0BQT2_PHAPC|nr:expressed protein [Phakopsora pachyrhizi]CAH7688403.1 expressed protein [Phakopsora pachyrhizi]